MLAAEVLRQLGLEVLDLRSEDVAAAANDTYDGGFNFSELRLVAREIYPWNGPERVGISRCYATRFKLFGRVQNLLETATGLALQDAIASSDLSGRGSGGSAAARRSLIGV